MANLIAINFTYKENTITVDNNKTQNTDLIQIWLIDNYNKNGQNIKGMDLIFIEFYLNTLYLKTTKGKILTVKEEIIWMNIIYTLCNNQEIVFNRGRIDYVFDA